MKSTGPLVLRSCNGLPPERQPVEIVERKGLGHPDTICDALAEQFSLALCRFYQERFGCLLHHNVDKALLWGGRSRPAFGGGEVLAPFEVFLAGRATEEFQEIRVPLETIAAHTCKQWLGQNFHALDPERQVQIHCLVRPASADLAELYARAAARGIWLANDTSCGVGYAPLSTLERVVFGVERGLNRAEFKQLCPEIGEDIKIMGIRRGRAIHLTVACAFVDRFVPDLEGYCRQKVQLQEAVLSLARQITREPVTVALNTADDLKAGSIYLTVTGTSAEAGDDGQVGRGNRANGLIAPYRPMTLEAVAGKNPVTHVGKVYNLLAGQIAAALVAEIPEVTGACCYLVSQIGQPVGEPQLIDVQLELAAAGAVEECRPQVEAIVWGALAESGNLWQALLEGEMAAC